MSGRRPAATLAGVLSAGRIRALRQPRAAVDPWRPLGVELEEERTLDGRRVPALTVFLAGAECPFTCVFCDLWRFTLDGPTPPGALPAQLERALAEAGSLPATTRVKLYNASNFFEARAVPPADLPAIARLVAGFERVVVECHPRLVGAGCLAFAERLEGRLEVAMGLETAHPETLARLGKSMDLAAFDAAACRLRRAGIALRVFVLVGAPYLPAGTTVEWALRSAVHALEAGAQTISLIPVRGGNGALERLAREGHWRPPTLADLEAAVDRAMAAVGGRAVVAADLWDAGRLPSCRHCRERRLERLRRLALEGVSRSRVACARCAGEPA